MVLTPVVGLAVAALAIGYEAGTGHSSSDVLFSGGTAMGPLLAGSAGVLGRRPADAVGV